MTGNSSLHKEQPSGNVQTSGFFKIIRSSVIEEKKMAISSRFVHEFGKDLFQVATVTLDDGFVWKIGLERHENKIFFSHGWKQFMEYYSIECGLFLFFKYEGNSQFHVHICGKTTFFVDLSSQGPNRNNETDDQPILKNCSSAHHQKHVKREDVAEISEPLAKTSHKSKSKGTSRRALEAARKFKSANLNYMIEMKSYCQKTTSYPYFPAFFANHLRTARVIKLQTSGSNRQWDVFLRIGLKGGMTLSRGWLTFSRDNNLVDRDVCIFELIHGNVPVLKVQIFRNA